ncbi:hypothetical protein BDL97_10G010700 [Sphagnum fallax]|nr:hypothetical protein BDL97_10G010700 [Sphagnum fallax]KAH8949066.1 hypothetical protein BDL97_10G010700 [Sphagnum fallax]KAH8949067.1 hypothetical protein BDL97_10G010700 [Sphagnum fallax]KAH8949068.1 hypothetical protein BDL97_10G010700 [Sphagnum fallax]
MYLELSFSSRHCTNPQLTAAKWWMFLSQGGIVPGIKVDKGLVPLAGSNNESWCQGLDGLTSRTAAYYKQGARFAKWRTVISIPSGPSELAVTEAAWGLARYTAISQDNGLVPIVEPEILLDASHGIDRTLEVAQKVWSKVFFLAENNVSFEGILLKLSMVTHGAECQPLRRLQSTHSPC